MEENQLTDRKQEEREEKDRHTRKVDEIESKKERDKERKR